MQVVDGVAGGGRLALICLLNTWDTRRPTRWVRIKKSRFGREIWNFYLASHDPFGVPTGSRLIFPSEQLLGNIGDAEVGLEARESSEWARFTVGGDNVPWGIRSDIRPAIRASVVVLARPAVVAFHAQVDGRILRTALDRKQLRSREKSWSKPESFEVEAGQRHWS